MNGSRSYTGHHGTGETSLDALNRTIEGLEARIEGMLGRSAQVPGQTAKGAAETHPPQAYANAPDLDLVEGIRARKRALSNVSRPDASPSPADRSQGNADQPPAAHAPQAAAAAPTAPLRQARASELSETLVREMAALRAEMSELRNEARQQALPEDLRSDLAGISAAIDALGTQDPGTDTLRLELNSMREMIDRMAREDSIRSLETRWQAMEEQVSGLDVGGLRDELINLAYRVDDIRAALSTRPQNGQSQAIETRITELSATIEAMSRQLSEPDPQTPRQLEQLGERLDEISRAIASIPAPAAPEFDLAPFERLEARLASVSQKIDEMEPAGVTSDIGDRIEHLSARVAQLADEEAIARLDARIERLQTMLEEGSRDSAMPELSDHLADISGKIEAIDARGMDASLVARLDDLAAQIDKLSAVQPQESVVPDAVIGRLEALIGRAEQTASQSVDPLPGLETLDVRLSEIAARLQQAETANAATAMHPPAGLEHVEAQLAHISARLEQTADTPPQTIPGIELLEARLADIADRLDMSSVAAAPGEEILRGLEVQIANLSQLISSAPHPPALDAFDDRFASIEEHLATSDEFIVEAARQAAEAALSAYSGQAGAHQSPQSIANIEVITALADDLKALETLSRNTDDRTMRAFEAVQDTLLKIAGRLEKLDNVPATAGLANMREAVAEARNSFEAAMPPASVEALDSAMQHEDGPEPDPYADNEPAFVRNGFGARAAHSPSEAAALAAAYAEREEAGEVTEPDLPAGSAGEKSFLSGLAARIRPGKETQPQPETEPAFSGSDAPPLDPSMELDPTAANMPLEPGSGAPDINRILQKVREAQAAERQRGGSGDDGSDQAEFLASARRAAMAAAAEVETIGRKGNGASSGGLLAVLKSRRRPILLAAGAVLLAVMSFPLVSGLLSSDDSDVAAVDPALSEPAIIEPAVVEPAAPVVLEPLDAPRPQAELDRNQTDDAVARLPAVRVVEPGSEPATETMAQTAIAPDIAAGVPAATSPEETAAIATAQPSSAASSGQASAEGAGAAPAGDPVLMAELDALPEAAASGALKAAAAQANPLALYEIGARFTEGRGVEIDLVRAASWYQRAADMGHAPSQYRIANFYEKGSGVERDLAAAKKWYQMAAEQGNASAMHNLAVLYATAGAAPDFASAANWFERAAEVGVRDSQVNLAILYARGDGVSRDLVQSYKWFAIAANDGDKDAAVKRDEVFNALRPEQAEAARAAVAEWTAQPVSPDANGVEVPAAWAGDSTETAAVDMSKAVRNIQAILNNNGFDAGAPDGVMGKRTKAAIKAFQTSIGMEPTGEIDDRLVKELLARNG